MYAYSMELRKELLWNVVSKAWAGGLLIAIGTIWLPA
jgi:hypothetical protein